jgi:hypothetical protein
VRHQLLFLFINLRERKKYRFILSQHKMSIKTIHITNLQCKTIRQLIWKWIIVENCIQLHVVVFTSPLKYLYFIQFQFQFQLPSFHFMDITMTDSTTFCYKILACVTLSKHFITQWDHFFLHIIFTELLKIYFSTYNKCLSFTFFFLNPQTMIIIILKMKKCNFFCGKMKRLSWSF